MVYKYKPADSKVKRMKAAGVLVPCDCDCKDQKLEDLVKLGLLVCEEVDTASLEKAKKEKEEAARAKKEAKAKRKAAEEAKAKKIKEEQEAKAAAEEAKKLEQEAKAAEEKANKEQAEADNTNK